MKPSAARRSDCKVVYAGVHCSCGPDCHWSAAKRAAFAKASNSSGANRRTLASRRPIGVQPSYGFAGAAWLRRGKVIPGERGLFRRASEARNSAAEVEKRRSSRPWPKGRRPIVSSPARCSVRLDARRAAARSARNDRPPELLRRHFLPPLERTVKRRGIGEADRVGRLCTERRDSLSMRIAECAMAS